jgi:two-component system response regulator NreC
VDLAASERPDIVIMDIAMPHLNGVEAARQIATRNPQTSIVILSMHSDESYVIRSLKAGARA